MHGKERLLLWTLVILAAGTLLAAVSSSLAVLIVARFIQGASGGIFPLAFGIVRDEFPREKVAGSIGLLSAILGVGAGVGIVLSGVIVEHLNYHWLFWLPLVAVVLAAVATWRFIPESPIRVADQLAGGGADDDRLSIVLLAISETTTWGWGSARTLGLILIGLLFTAAWIAVEVRSDNPLIDMTMMRVRGVWTTNLAAFLLGAGMYASFIVFPQFAQLPTSTGFGFGASVVVSGCICCPRRGDDDPRHVRRADLRSLRLARGAAERHGLHHRLVRAARRGPQPPLRAADRRRAARRRDRPRLRGPRQPDRAGGLDPPDGGGERHEHRDAHARRRARRAALGDVHRRQRGARRADGDGLHRDVRDGHRLPGGGVPGGVVGAEGADRAAGEEAVADAAHGEAAAAALETA